MGGGRCVYEGEGELLSWDEANFPTSGEIQAQMPTIVDVVSLAQRKQLKSCKCNGRKGEGWKVRGRRRRRARAMIRKQAKPNKQSVRVELSA